MWGATLCSGGFHNLMWRVRSALAFYHVCASKTLNIWNYGKYLINMRVVNAHRWPLTAPLAPKRQPDIPRCCRGSEWAGFMCLKICKCDHSLNLWPVGSVLGDAIPSMKRGNHLTSMTILPSRRVAALKFCILSPNLIWYRLTWEITQCQTPTSF